MQSEKEFQQQILDLCKLLGLKAYHTHDSRRSAAGFPDLVIVGKKVIFAELKTEKGIVSKAQMEWIDALNRAEQIAVVWRPDDWDIINDVLHGLAGRRIPSRR